MMLRTLFISSLALSLTGGLTACSTVTDNIPTVKIERKKTKRIKTVETAQQVQVQQASYGTPKVQKAEAAMVCENDNMRSRAADRDMKNDMARVLILEEGGRSSNIIADVEVNCRDYFESQTHSSVRTIQSAPAYSVTQSAPMPTYTPQSHKTIIAAPAPSIKEHSQPRVVKASTPVEAADGYYYSIKKGDTMYSIARENCSSVKDISRLNGISDPTRIDVQQIIRLPAKKCNARN